MDGKKDLELAYLSPKATKEKSRLRPMHPVVDYGSETGKSEWHAFWKEEEWWK
jgi:hypothetical protein